MENTFQLKVRYYRLSAALEPYFTALYSFTIETTDPAGVEDCLHPEWAAMRFTAYGTPPQACVVPDPIGQCPPFVVSGPTSRAIRFRLVTSRLYGLGLRPAGWARFVGQPASEMANRIVDGAHSNFASFAPLLDVARELGKDEAATAARMNACLEDLLGRTPAISDRIYRIQDGLADPDLQEVDELAALLGISRRSLERLFSRHVGFPPKTMLRRQRFLRSLGRYMLDAGTSWSKALDKHYYDQAHFVRDFRDFMGMTPSDYAEMRHPILDTIIGQRMFDQGAMTRPDLPTILRYAEKPPFGELGQKN